jgi:tetratricopeptide (TPR) repeat protein
MTKAQGMSKAQMVLIWFCLAIFVQFSTVRLGVQVMIQNKGSKVFRTGLWACVLMVFLASATVPAQTNVLAAVGTDRKSEEAASSPETLRSYLQIQEQLHNTQLAIERNRQETEAANARNAELLQGRLSLLEKSLASQRLDELKDLQRSNRLVLIAAGIFALIGFLVLLFTAFLQWSAVNRLATVAAALPGSHALGMGHVPAALGLGETQLVGAGSVEESTTRFVGTIERLERRLHEMENAMFSKRSLAEPTASNGNGNGNGHDRPTPGASAENGNDTGALPPPTSKEAGAVNLLLGKGETLLKLDQMEGALACFEEALTIDPASAEALVRKGLALERLQRLDEAIVCYDRAIATDTSMTMAYLYKGGVFNRMERYSEALECYEKALKTQAKGPAANVIVD